jgi:hypothetical protein
VTSVETPAAKAPAIRKIRSAAITFGMYAQTAPTKAVSAAIPSTEAAIEIAPRKIAQNVIVPRRRDGCGTTRSMKLPPMPRCTVRSRPAPRVARVMRPPTTFATMYPINKTARNPMTRGSQPKNTLKPCSMVA